MKQSQTYRRGQKGNVVIDPDDYNTYRYAVAMRILRKRRGRISRMDAYQLAAVPAFFYWLFRGPVGFFKKMRVGRRIDKRLKSNTERKKNG